MAGTAEIMNEILANLRTKYNRVNQLMDQTKDLEQSARSGDEVSFGISLDMRLQVMSNIDKLDARNRSLTDSLPEPLHSRISKLLQPSGDSVQVSNPLETDIFDTQRRILSVLQRIIVLDEDIQRRTGSLQRKG